MTILTSTELHEIWPSYSPSTSTTKCVFALVSEVNDHFKERIPVWPIFIDTPVHFSHFFAEVLHLILNDTINFDQRTMLIYFLNNCFNSLEVSLVRQEVSKLCSFPILINLQPAQRNKIFLENPKVKKFWGIMEKKMNKMEKNELDTMDFNRKFLWKLLQLFKRVVDFVDDETKELDITAISFCETFLLFLIDMETQIMTRRFFNILIQSSHVITHCQLSQFIRAEHGSLFCELLELLKFYVHFEIDDFSSLALTPADIVRRHYEKITDLQKATFKLFSDDPQLLDFSLLSVASIDTGGFLRKHLSVLSLEKLYKIAEYLDIVPPLGSDIDNNNYSRINDPKYLLEEIIFRCERRPSQLQKINSQPLYPSEEVIWDEKLVPYDNYDGRSVLPLNKLNLQFLTLHDYLLRNFNLFKAESTYEIRHDLEDVLFRMKPWQHETGSENEVVWGGWARMALPISGTKIVSVLKPNVGETAPAEVKSDIQISLPKRQERAEWESLRKNDVLFLLKVIPIQPVGYKFDPRLPFKSQFKIAGVRGCEVEGLIGNEGRVLDEMESRESLRKLAGDSRTYRVRLDPNQYETDVRNGLETDLYFSFNLLIRRDPKTNNFKAVLATIRQLLNTECVVPDWLHDLILGYAEPDIANYTRMNGTVATVDFNDTFLSFEHLRRSFPENEIVCTEENPTPPFRLTFKEFEAQHNEAIKSTSIVVEHQKKFNRVLTEAVHKNQIEFTPAQVEAVKAGMQPGLTLVVGPPGTGKTDVAVQIISNIYHNWPEQRTLLVTHSNQALNALFEKIIKLDVDERHLLRMGHGEEALETVKDFSRYGRVDYVLAERNRLLRQVEALRESLGEVGDVSYSCETAGYFYRYTICKTWEYFMESLENAKTAPGGAPKSFVLNHFPFSRFFELLSRLPEFVQGVEPLNFCCDNLEKDMELAFEAWFRIQDIFKKLEEFRAFELLRNGRERADYLLVKESKIIAMTCTHAALRRRELVELGFHYDNILMEEAAQILEVETFIPLLLQDPHDGRNRLKRWIMIGDHHQLPPVVQNPAYQKFANMEQSLFARLIRSGVPHIQLDAQGRARSEIASLYNWHYKQLGDLPHVLKRPEFMQCNPGFAHIYQIIDVPDFNGYGETTPSPYFYQNLGEAEYAVALFIYMRVVGYPASKITLLTTYNGQASLLRDIVQKRCASNPLIGEPAKISTVDKYQGQQNEYIILSLVRTKHIGHIRDARRLIVALSRARLGLYILARVSLFERCYELRHAFKRLLERPTQLLLLPNESFDMQNPRQPNDPLTCEPTKIVDTSHISHFVGEFYNSNLELLKHRHMIENAHFYTKQTDEETRRPEKDVTVNEPQPPIIQEVAMQEDGTQNKHPGAEERTEGAIVFDQVDFERLQEIPKY